MLWLGEGGGTRAVLMYHPCQTGSGGWVGTLTQERAVLRQLCLIFPGRIWLVPGRLGLGTGGPVPVYAVMPMESEEVLNTGLSVCT